MLFRKLGMKLWGYHFCIQFILLILLTFFNNFWRGMRVTLTSRMLDGRAPGDRQNIYQNIQNSKIFRLKIPLSRFKKSKNFIFWYMSDQHMHSPYKNYLHQI